MKKSIISLFSLSLCLATFATNVNYTPDNVSIFRNPERGFTEELSKIVSDDKNHIIKGNESFFSETKVNSETGYPVARPSETLVMVLYNLKNYRKTALTKKMLTGFDEDMQALRNVGFKCVLRFAYTEDEDDKDDAGLERIQEHIGQLAPYLKKNADVIYALEAGFVGVWGEWYYSKYFGDETQNLEDKEQPNAAKRYDVIDALLEAVPADRFLLVRYPMIKQQYLAHKGINTDTLTSAEAFTNTIKARIGCHNDAFLNTYGDNGTYASVDKKGNEKSDDPKVRAYVAAETLYVPNGGETNVEDDPKDEDPHLSSKVYNKAETQMAEYHWSFCGESYAVAVTNKWHTGTSTANPSSNIFDELNRKMGYRYQLINGSYSDQAAPGGKMSVNITLKNVGYAPLYNYREAKIVLKNGSKVYPIKLDSDPRRWAPNGAITTISEQITVPADVPAGTYQLYLAMPDTASKLKDDARFAIRFANEGNLWDANTGMNKLNATITISGSAVTTPIIAVSTTSENFGNVTLGSSASRTFTVTGYNLTNNVAVSSNNAALTVSPTSITKANAESSATVTMTLNPSAAGSGSAVVTVASSGATSQIINVTWNAKAAGSHTGVELPATLDKSNMYQTSDNTWWTNDASYYDFGSDDSPNTDRYIDWKVYLHYPKAYTVSVVRGFPGDDNADGFTLRLQLLSGETLVSQYDADESWAEAEKTYTAQWNLSDVEADDYVLRAMNIAEYEQPKLKSVTLQADVPTTGNEAIFVNRQSGQATKVIRNGQLLIIRDGKTYNAQGAEVR